MNELVVRSPNAILPAVPKEQLALLDKAVNACDIAVSYSATTAEHLRNAIRQRSRTRTSANSRVGSNT
jgi:hypothetical protein